MPKFCCYIFAGLLEIIKGKILFYKGLSNYQVGMAIGHYVLPYFFARFVLGIALFTALHS
jgi:hypothetical protein